MRSPALALAALLAAPLAARAQAPAEVAQRLFRGEVGPAEAAAAWEAAKLEPDDALSLVRGLLPYAEGAPGDHRVRLRDGFERETEARVFVPEAPGEGGRYGLVVLLHGLGGDSDQAFDLGKALAPPGAIIVAPTAQKPHARDEAEDLRLSRLAKIPVLARFEHWWSYRERCFALAARDHALAHYPVDPDRVLLVGYSMGGFGAWNVGLRYPDRFAGVTAAAGGISREEFALGRDALVRALLPNARAVPFFFLHGDEDEVVPVRFDRWSQEDLDALKIEHVYEEVAGGKHVLTDFLAGDALRDRLIAWTRARRRDAHPARVEHHAIGAYHAAAFWVRVDALAGERARVTAEALGKNRFQVSTEGVARLTLFLDPELCQPRKTVQVALDGKLAFKGKVRPTLLAVAESFARSRDPALTYAHALTLEAR